MATASSINHILPSAIQRLREAGCDTPRLDAELLLAALLNQERTWLHIHPAATLTPAQRQQFESWLTRRERREPIAYILGWKEFFGLTFKVTPAVLIPRPETELLVETVLAWIKRRANNGPERLRLADVGTGSGCLAVVLAKHLPTAKIVAVDVSPSALRVAQANAERHSVADRITFYEGDLLEPLSGPFDLILSNPPYVSHVELSHTEPEVQQYEPRSALDGGVDGLATIRRLLSQARVKLKPEALVLIEIGAAQGPDTLALAKEYFPAATVGLKQDLAGRDRILVIEA